MRHILLHSPKVYLLLVILFFGGGFTSYADDSNIATKRRADFVLKIASKIHYHTQGVEVYTIGVYGRGKDMKSLVNELNRRKNKIVIQGKKVEIKHFKSTRKISQVDLIYVPGDSKIKISDLNDKLEGYPYILLTENFPFGTSMLNFALNEGNELIYEIHPEIIAQKGATIDKLLLTSTNRIKSEAEWKRRLEEALLLVEEKSNQIKTQKIKINKKVELIDAQEQKLDAQEQTIDAQEQTIVTQVENIEEKKVVISYLISAIVIGIISIVIISLLMFILLRTKRSLQSANTKNKDVTESINYGQLIQEAILPNKDNIFSSFSDGLIMYRPRDIVSGDFYWYDESENSIVLCVADCTGHGVPGALMSIMGNSLLNTVIKKNNINDPAAALHMVDENLVETLHKKDKAEPHGMDIGIVNYNKKTKQIQYAGANHPLVLIRKGELIVIPASRQGVGNLHIEKRENFKNVCFDVEPGDTYYMLTDGYQDQFGGPSEKKFMRKKLYNLLIDIHKKPMDEQKSLLVDSFEQ